VLIFEVERLLTIIFDIGRLAWSADCFLHCLNIENNLLKFSSVLVANSATLSSNLVQASMVLVFVFFLSDIECLGMNEFVKCIVFMFCSGSVRGVLLFLFTGYSCYYLGVYGCFGFGCGDSCFCFVYLLIVVICQKTRETKDRNSVMFMERCSYHY